MAPYRFKKYRKAWDETLYRDEVAPASNMPSRPPYETSVCKQIIIFHLDNYAMAPSRFTKDRKARDVTPYRDEVAPASIVPLRPTTPHPDRQAAVIYNQD